MRVKSCKCSGSLFNCFSLFFHFFIFLFFTPFFYLALDYYSLSAAASNTLRARCAHMHNKSLPSLIWVEVLYIVCVCVCASTHTHTHPNSSGSTQPKGELPGRDINAFAVFYCIPDFFFFNFNKYFLFLN